jgi:receptor protein-tyrosine kinase
MKGGAEENPRAADRQSLFTPAWTIAGKDAAQPDKGSLPDAGPADGESPRRPPLAVLRFSSEWRERLANAPQANASLVEQYRRLAATLHQAHRTSHVKTVMVTSASPNDGKTFTAVNLALVLAESYRYKVLLIDADLRRPSIPSVVDLDEGTGLSENLRATSDQKLALVALTPGLTLLPAGQPIANSIEALTSPRMRHILDEAAMRFDWVILDAAPVGQTTDARLLTEMVDGTLFVIRAGQTQYPDVLQAIQALGRDSILGVVLNGVDAAPSESYSGVPRSKTGS